MVFYLLTVLALTLFQAQVYPRGELSKNYMSIKNTTAVKGAFMLLVFSRHFKSYTGLYSVYDQPFKNFDVMIGQLIVVMFFFYSGYGVYVSFLKKGIQYIKDFPRKRILLTFVNFALAVILFIIIDCCLGIWYEPSVYILAFTGYTSVGNSCWYIFAALCLYGITWLGFIRLSKHPKWAILLTTLLTVGYIVVMMWLKQDGDWWYNTVIAYPFGMWYAYFKDDIEEVFYSRYDLYKIFLVLSIVGTGVLMTINDIFIFYECLVIFFASMIVLITMKIDIYNVVIYRIGSNLFIMYIMQRIPMIILSYFNITYFSYASLIAAIVITYVIACIFKIIYKRVDNIVLGKTKPKRRSERKSAQAAAAAPEEKSGQPASRAKLASPAAQAELANPAEAMSRAKMASETEPMSYAEPTSPAEQVGLTEPAEAVREAELANRTEMESLAGQAELAEPAEAVRGAEPGSSAEQVESGGAGESEQGKR